MDPAEFPPNSHASRKQSDDRTVTRVTSSDAIRKKKSLGKQLKETFIAGDLKTSIQYSMIDIFLPAARDMVLDVIIGGFEKLFLGDSRRRGGSTTPQHGGMGVVNYQRYAMGGGSRMSSPQRVMSRMARARHDFDDIILSSRTEAEEVLEQLYELVSQYESAKVADLYELIGVVSTHADQKWGWTDLRGSGVHRTREGYLLDLPDPTPL